MSSSSRGRLPLAKAVIAAGAIGALLSACTSPQQQQRSRMARSAQQVLERIDTIGDPGRVAAADFAFARMAQDEGQWTAFLATAAAGAQIHGVNGVFPAEPWLLAQDNPAQSVSWAPNTVWTSCDGTVAISFGRFQQPEGQVGSYITVWELQQDRSYKWTYDMGALDNPQPVREADPDIPENAIIVPGMTSIEGRIADCPVSGEATPEIPIVLMPLTRSGSGASDDGTLRWGWFHTPAGNRSFLVDWVRDGEVQRALIFEAPPAPAGY